MSHVAMEQKQCVICGIINKHKTGILLHKYLKDIPEDKTITGTNLCEKCEDLNEQGYIALIVVSNPHTGKDKQTIRYIDADRTGQIVHLKRKIFNNMFQQNSELPFVYIEPEVFKLLEGANNEITK